MNDHQHTSFFSLFLLLTVVWICCALPGFTLAAEPARQDSTGTPHDSAKKSLSNYKDLLARTKAILERERVNSKTEFLAHQAIAQQNEIFQAIRNEIERAHTILKQGYSYQKIKHEIVQLKKWQKIAGEGVVFNKDSSQSVRNLTTTSILLKELISKVESQLQGISAYQKTLEKLQHNLDSLLMDSVLYLVPNDSVALTRYFQKIVLLNKDYQPVITPMRTAIDSVEKLELDVKLIKFSLEADLAETEAQRKTLFDNLSLIENGRLHHHHANEKPVAEVVNFSWKKAQLVLVFYILNHIYTLVLMILFILGIGFFLIVLRTKNSHDKSPIFLKKDEPLFRHPFVSSTLIVITVFQFFLPLPPFVFNGLLWVISGAALLVIMRKSSQLIWFNTWLVFYTLFLVGYLGNLLLRPSAVERWLMPFFLIALLVAGFYYLVQPKKVQKKDKFILLFIGIMVFLELLAFGNYLTGGYNQAKILMAGGVFNILIAYFVYWTAHLGRRLLHFSSYFFRNGEDDHPKKEKNFGQGKLPVIFYFLFFIAWFILLSRNFYFYQILSQPLSEWVIQTRTLGEFSFTFKGIFIFFGVLVLSGIISQVVSFLASDTSSASMQSKSSGLGSWLLLIRIAIITLGVMLAFISAGIPMDKFAIILGALSVGIGFGMQTLVNNLVSGLIIAFEKPVNVGDIVEIAGKNGKMKSIGIRSSIVTTWDGADVIIPNGDLLNQHLVNWTLGSRRSRFNLVVGVAYGTSLEEVTRLLMEVMVKDHRILKNPHPLVLADQFNNSSIDLILKFWVADFNIGLDVKSDLLVAIDNLFKEHGIEIPFPQQDVHIKPDKEVPGKM